MGKNKIAFLGGSSGLGVDTIPHLSDYDVISLGSGDVNFLDNVSIDNFFNLHEDVGVVIIFNNYNHNSFVHKYDASNFQYVDKQIDINIKGVVKCISSALRVMRECGFGRIILASSITVDRKVVGTSIYSACKAFYENLVKTIAIENASKGITANCIQLGYMDGGLTYTIDERVLSSIVSGIPAKRLGTAEEIAKTIIFLIENEYVNGSVLKLTGGL